MITAHINWIVGGYHYWTSIKAGYGWRQIGREWRCTVDDYGTLVPVAVVRCSPGAAP